MLSKRGGILQNPLAQGVLGVAQIYWSGGSKKIDGTGYQEKTKYSPFFSVFVNDL